MAKGEKVKPKPKPSPPSSDSSDIDSSDESSDEEIDLLLGKMDKKSTAFIVELVRELEKTQDTLVSERSEVEALRLEVDQVGSIISTLKEDLAASQAQCNSLKSRNEELEEQLSLLWSSTSNPPKTMGDPSALLARVVKNVITLI